MLRKVSKKESLTQCQHFFFLSFFIPLFFSFVSFIFASLLVYKSFRLFLFFFHFCFFLLASNFFRSFFTSIFLVSNFYYKSMSTIFYHKFNVQSNSKKNLLKLSRIVSIESFKKCSIFILMQICISCVVKIQCRR